MTCSDDESNQLSLSFDKEEIQDLHTILEWVVDQKLPFLSDEFSEVRWKIRRARFNGCFIHSVIRGKFEINPNETIDICPDCDPITFRNLVKNGHKCIRAPTKFGIPMTDAGPVDEEKE